MAQSAMRLHFRNLAWLAVWVVGGAAAVDAWSSDPIDRPSAREAEQAPLAAKVGERFRDCAECPEMVVLPAGFFMMGSPPSEAGHGRDEGEMRRVDIGQPFALGAHEVTRGEFGRFVDATGHVAGNSCHIYARMGWKAAAGRNWRDPGFEQDDSHPVVCVSWQDAQAYANWLSRIAGKPYRLPSEAEWEYAARGGSRTARYWGAGASEQCRHANGADLAAKRRYGGWRLASCDDGHVHSAPVGSYRANAFGLHDALGNVWEWTQDCWNDDYSGAPSDGSAWQQGDCAQRVLRGGAWLSKPPSLRAANRGKEAIEGRYINNGFRLARTLAPSEGNEPRPEIP